MAVQIGHLSAILSVNSAQFDAGMKKSAGATGQFNGVLGISNRLLATFGASLSVVGFARMIGGTIEAIDQQVKLADRLGISTEKLAGLEHAAELSGVGTEGLHSNLDILNRNLGQAALKGGPAAEALNRIGLSARDLMAQSPDEQLRQIADGFKRIESPALRARTAADLFGRGGANMVNMLKDGRRALDDAQKEAEDFGLAMSRDMAAKVEDANDEITRMWAAMAGFKIELTLGFAPAITSTAQAITGLVKEYREWYNAQALIVDLTGQQITMMERTQAWMFGAKGPAEQLGLSRPQTPSPPPPMPALPDVAPEQRAQKQFELWAKAAAEFQMRGRGLRSARGRRGRSQLVERQDWGGAPGSVGEVDTSLIDLRSLIKPREIESVEDQQLQALQEIAKNTATLKHDTEGLL